MTRLRLFADWTLPWHLALLSVAALGAASCSASGSASSDGGSGGSGASTSSSDGGGGGLFTGSGGGGGGDPSGCSEAAKLIYIVGVGNNLYSFYPPTLELKSVGVINCPQGGGSATPFSMAVDRQGIAWVLFSDGRIYNVNTLTASCAATGYQPNQQGWSVFGMGFVSNTPGSADETLYLGDYYGSGLGKINTTALTLSVVAPYSAIHTAAELTGTGDARLFGFFQGVGNNDPIIIAEVDKSNGGILSQAPQPSVNIGSGWAFAFWGGDFYLFTSPNNGNSQIDRYQPATGMTSTVKTNLGDNIVGAGVSTCAPTEPPE